MAKTDQIEVGKNRAEEAALKDLAEFSDNQKKVLAKDSAEVLELAQELMREEMQKQRRQTLEYLIDEETKIVNRQRALAAKMAPFRKVLKKEIHPENPLKFVLVADYSRWTPEALAWKQEYEDLTRDLERLLSTKIVVVLEDFQGNNQVILPFRYNDEVGALIFNQGDRLGLNKVEHIISYGAYRHCLMEAFTPQFKDLEFYTPGSSEGLFHGGIRKQAVPYAPKITVVKVLEPTLM